MSFKLVSFFYIYYLYSGWLAENIVGDWEPFHRVNYSTMYSAGGGTDIIISCSQ